MKQIYITCCILLAIALFPLPIGFYTLVRIIISIGAIIAAVQSSKDRLNTWGILFSILVVLFNPVIPVYLHDKGAWMVIDIIAIIIFICYIKKSKTNEKH